MCVKPYNDAERVHELSTGFTCDEDCLKAGSRWSHVYITNGMILVCIILNFVCVAVGAYKGMLRVIAALFSLCLCIPHFAIIIATGVYRFRTIGLLCAESLTPTNKPSKDAEIDDSWTMRKDAQLILALWLVQLLCCAFTCVLGAVGPLMIKPRLG